MHHPAYTWLLKKDRYTPVKDHDRYIRNTIIALLGTLSRIRRGGVLGSGFVYRLHPSLKVICALLLTLLLSLSNELTFVLLVNALLLLTVSMLHRRDTMRILLTVGTVALFAAVIMLPAFVMGFGKNSPLLVLKITGSAAAVNVLAHTTKSSHLTRAMSFFHIPPVFILILDITLKYIIILGEFSILLLSALKLRSIGKNNAKHQSLGNILGVLFMKSKEMAEQTYAAMQCRGFTGEYQYKGKSRLGRRDAAVIAVMLIITGAFLL